MWRWSKEPRRISVVEGRAAASLARALMIVVCFIYNNETQGNRFCQSLPKHFFHLCFGVRRVRAPKRNRSSIPCDSHGTGPLEQRAVSEGDEGAAISSDPCAAGPVFSCAYCKRACALSLIMAVNSLCNNPLRVSRQKLARGSDAAALRLVPQQGVTLVIKGS